MVPGYVQGLSRVPPDQPEGGEGGELYSQGLWKTLNIQHPATNFHPRTAPQSHPKPLQCDIKATPKPVDSHLIGTPKPPQCDPNATLKLGDPEGTSLLPGAELF